MSQMSHLPIPDAPGLFADALLTDTGSNLLFLSVWGRDTAMQEFIARLSLSREEGGLAETWIGAGVQRYFVQGLQGRELVKLSGRTPAQTIFGSLAHVWLYDRLAVAPDRANRRALMLHDPATAEDVLQERLWRVVQETCHLPLLPAWREVIVETCRRHGWLHTLQGIAVNAIAVDLGQAEFEETIETCIRIGRLTLD